MSWTLIRAFVRAREQALRLASGPGAVIQIGATYCTLRERNILAHIRLMVCVCVHVCIPLQKHLPPPNAIFLCP